MNEVDPLFFRCIYAYFHQFMHESCLLMCRPCFNTMELWTFDPNLHLSLVDTTFYLLSCVFACLFVFFLVHLCISFALSPVTCYACYIYYAYPLYALSYALRIFFFCCLSTSFLSLPLHVRTWSEDVWS